MDIEKVEKLLFDDKQLSIQESVDIINVWRAHPSKYYQLIKKPQAAVPLWGYDYYSKDEQRHVFNKTDKMILAPSLANKFFECEKDSLIRVFLQTLDVLTFTEDAEDYEDENDKNEEYNGFYHWPYFNVESVSHLSADIIEEVLQHWHYVFDCEKDYFGRVYNMMYLKLLEGQKCCDSLAVNSFNQDDWQRRDEVPVAIRAKHYIMSNYSVADNNGDEDAYFRKLAVIYLQGMWDNLDGVVKNIMMDQVSRNN